MQCTRSSTVTVSVTSTAVMLLAAALITSSQPRRAEATVGPQAGRDLAVDPPKVESVSAMPLGVVGASGNSLLLVRFAHGEQLAPQIVVHFEGRSVTLRDDGQGGDATAGDRTFSAPVFLDFQELATNQDRVRILNGTATRAPTVRRGPRVLTEEQAAVSGQPEVLVPKFEDHRSVAARLAPVVDFRNLAPGDVVSLHRLCTVRAVDPEESLVIRDLRVVEDPRRTYNPCTNVGTPLGKWTFGYLMQHMANEEVTGVSPSMFVREWLNSWVYDQTIDGWTVAKREKIQQLIIDPWEQASGGPGTPLDLAQAPFKLLAIVNRVDLRGSAAYGSRNAGEARFVFGALDMRCSDCNTSCATKQ